MALNLITKLYGIELNHKDSGDLECQTTAKPPNPETTQGLAGQDLAANRRSECPGQGGELLGQQLEHARALRRR